MTFYIGMDESNYGKSPEFVVAVISSFEDDVLVKQIGKSRRRAGLDILEVLGERDFLYTIINENHKEWYDSNQLKIFSFSLLIESSLELVGDLELSLIDGKIDRNVSEGIRTVLKSKEITHKLKRLKGISKADKKYPIVNMADLIAYRLFKMNKEGSHIPEKYNSHFRPLIL